MKGLVLKNKKISLNANLPLPFAKKNEVLVKVKSSSINPTDLDAIEGRYSFITKLMGGKIYPVNTGLEFSGVVEKDGKRFKKGDRIFGYVDLFKGIKTHQEYITINEDFIALMPQNLNFDESAAIPLGTLTTLVALDDLGKINQNTNLLINGASGGLGVYAVQIARNFGGKITAIAGENQDKFLKDLGADKVINYKEKKLQNLKGNYDILLDLTGKLKFSSIKKLLAEKGKFIPANPLNNLLPIMGNLLRTKKVEYLVVGSGDYGKLTRISEWIEKGKLKSIIDSIYSLNEYKNAFKRMNEAGKRGRIILRIDDNQ